VADHLISRLVVSEKQAVCSVGDSGGEPKDGGVSCAKQKIAQSHSVPGKGNDHREQRDEAHTRGNVP
jgi:hypothetical protein